MNKEIEQMHYNRQQNSKKLLTHMASSPELLICKALETVIFYYSDMCHKILFLCIVLCRLYHTGMSKKPHSTGGNRPLITDILKKIDMSAIILIIIQIQEAI